MTCRPALHLVRGSGAVWPLTGHSLLLLPPPLHWPLSRLGMNIWQIVFILVMTADLWNKTVIIQVNECKLNSNVNMSGNDDDVRKVIIEIVTSDSGQCLVT